MENLVLKKRAMKAKKSSKANLKKLTKIIKKQINIINTWMKRLSLKKKANTQIKDNLSKKLMALESELKAIKDFEAKANVNNK